MLFQDCYVCIFSLCKYSRESVCHEKGCHMPPLTCIPGVADMHATSGMHASDCWHACRGLLTYMPPLACMPGVAECMPLLACMPGVAEMHATFGMHTRDY